VTVVHVKDFPFLDMKMCWDDESGDIRFLVFRKPNQALKYVDKNITHRATTFKSIAKGVFTQLARLTSKIAANQEARIDDIYPDHAEALFTADLAPPTDFPTFKELWNDDKKRKNKPMKTKRSKRDQRSVYFVIGHSNFSSRAKIPLLIKRLRKRCKVKWLRVSMAYQRFPNIRENLVVIY
jgi:hypothetical protein